jgi:hypothetical protein
MTKIEEIDWMLDCAVRRLEGNPGGALRAIEDARKKLAKLNAPLPAKEGVNPVTFRGVTKRGGGEKINFSIGRLAVGKPGEEESLLTVVAWKGEDNEPVMLANMVIEEEKFIEGIKFLFNHGELNDKDLMMLMALRGLT